MSYPRSPVQQAYRCLRCEDRLFLSSLSSFSSHLLLLFLYQSQLLRSQFFKGNSLSCHCSKQGIQPVFRINGTPTFIQPKSESVYVLTHVLFAPVVVNAVVATLHDSPHAFDSVKRTNAKLPVRFAEFPSHNQTDSKTRATDEGPSAQGPRSRTGFPAQCQCPAALRKDLLRQECKFPRPPRIRTCTLTHTAPTSGV